jgi:hypothetical protein
MVFSTQTQAACSSGPNTQTPDRLGSADPTPGESLPIALQHELRTTIQLLLNLTDLLLQDADDNSPQLDYLQSLHQGTEQLLGLLDPQEQQPQIVNLHRLLKTLYSLLLPEALNQGLVLRIELAEDLPEYLPLRPNRLQRLLLTLMSHGIGLGRPDRGSLLLRASLEPGLGPDQLIIEILTPGSLTATTIEGQLALDLSTQLCQDLGGHIESLDDGLRLSIPVPIEATNPGYLPTAATTIALQVSDLDAMPIEWRQRLHQAALEGRDRQVQQLIDEIPPSQPSLIAALESLVEQCHLEVLLHLSEASLKGTNQTGL